MMQPISRQQSQPNFQTGGAPIPVFSPELEEMHSQAPYHFNPYQKSLHNGQFHPGYSYQPSELNGQFYSQQYHPLYNGQFHSQHSQQPLQFVDQFRSQNSQSVPLPPAQSMDQMNTAPGVSNFNMPREVQGAESTQLSPEIANSTDVVPKRPPMKEYFANARKRTANALAAEADDASTESDSSSSPVPKPTTTAPSDPPRSREPIQRPAREIKEPRTCRKYPEVATPKLQPDRQDKLENLEAQRIIGDEHSGMVTRSRAKKGPSGQPDVSVDQSNHEGKASAPISSLPVSISDGNPKQREQPGLSKGSVATATDSSSANPPSEELKEVSKKDFQELLKADDLMNVALKKGITNPVVLEAALLARLMAEDDDFSVYVESALNEVD